jgi:PKD repeat protein
VSQIPTTDNPESNTLNGILRWMGMTIFVGAILTGTSRRAAAATVTVNNTNDSGAGSLRDAVATANAGDTIAFNVPNGSVINLYNQIIIDKPLTISGPGAANLTVQHDPNAAGRDRIFDIYDNNPGNMNVTISGLTIAKGSGYAGAGIFNSENLTISGCVLTENDTQLNGQGGAIRSDGNLTVKDSTISGNGAWASGAAIASSSGNVTVLNSIISDNHVRGAYGPGQTFGYPGGAIFKTGQGLLKITGSTLSDNTATGSGGAVYLRGYYGFENEITACTLAGNTSDTAGGAIAISGNGTHFTLKNSTVSYNTSAAGGGGIRVNSGYNSSIISSTIVYNYSAGNGGGILCSNQELDLKSTIVSGNRSDSAGLDLNGRFFGDHSLVGSTSGANFYGYTNIIGQNPYLGPLQDNGGPTYTHALLAGSPCFEKGAQSGLATDQRGLPRVSGIKEDIGAFEAQAKSFIVKNLNDSGADSLRQCVLDANQNPGADIVTFQAGLSGTIALTTGQVSINDHTKIQGPGASVITVSGNNASRVLYAGDDNGGTKLEISISGLTVANGNASFAAGILSTENLILSDTVLTGNVSTGRGGGLSHYDGDLTIKNCTLKANSAAKGGGAYILNAYATIQNSTIDTNITTSKGGGIYLYDADLNVTNSTISGNRSGSRGGGIFLYGSTANLYNTTLSGNSATNGGGAFLYQNSSLNLTNSTVSGNSATSDGGGIYLYRGTLRAANSTIAFNTADSDASGNGDGGGIFLYGDNSPRAYLNNTIVAKNTGYAGASDISGFVQTNSNYNLIGVDTGSSNITNAAGGNQVGTGAAPLDPQLGPLQNNGGPTFTHAIDGSSLAHDTGSFGGFPPFDQRGTGFRRVSDRRVDIGAFEFQDPPLTFVVKNLNDSGPDSLRDCIAAANSAGTADIITFESGLSGTIALTSPQELRIYDHVSIVGPGANAITVTAAPNQRIFRVYGSGPVSLDVSISGLTLSGGSSRTGGAIFCGDNLTVSDCVITGNEASSGGAIYSAYGSSLILRNTTISNNMAYYGGGALAVPVYSSVLMENCTLSGNTALGGGGGIYISEGRPRQARRGGYESITLRNNTITNNDAPYGYGGGIFSGTIRRGQPENSPRDKGPGGPLGIFLTSNIIAKNTSIYDSAPDVSATVDGSGANNLIGIESGLAGIANGTNNNQIGTAATPIDPLLGPLQLNGGAVPTHNFLVGSPALDTGSNPAVLAGDERGDTFARDVGPQTDIGAFENQLPVVTIGGPYSIKFGDALTVAATATDADNDTLTYTWDINGDGTFGDATGANPTLTSAQLVALGVGVSGTFNVTVQVSDGFHSVTASTTLTVANTQPPVVEPPIVTPTPGIVNGEVTVTVSATDPNGLPLTFLFDWGDGTTSTSNTHVYATPGTYTITVTVSNGSSSTTVTTKVIVALNMKATKLKGVTHFGKPGLDFCHLTTIIPDIKPGFSPAGKTMDVDFGGVKRSFTLDAKGKANTGDSTVRLQLKFKSGKTTGGATRLWVNLNKGDFAAAWKDEGLDPAKPLFKASIPFIITITMDGTTYLGSLKTTANSNATVGQFHTTVK